MTFGEGGKRKLEGSRKRSWQGQIRKTRTGSVQRPAEEKMVYKLLKKDWIGSHPEENYEWDIGKNDPHKNPENYRSHPKENYEWEEQQPSLSTLTN